MPDDVLEGQLGDTERRGLDLPGWPGGWLVVGDLDRDADVGALLGTLSQLFDGGEEAEFLQHDRSTVRGEVVEFDEDVPEGHGQLLGGASTFGLGQRPSDGRHDIGMQFDGDPGALGGRGTTSTGVARRDLIDEDASGLVDPGSSRRCAV